MKVLVIRFSSIGDVVLTSPVVRCLKLQRGAEIHYLTKRSFTSILSASPYIDRVHSIDKALSEIIEILKVEDFDLIIDLHKNLRSWMVRRKLGKRSLTFQKSNVRKWLMVRLKPHAMEVDHIVNRYMHALKPLDIKYDGAGLDYFLQPAGEGIPVLSKPYLCFGIGGTHSTKRMPTDKIREVCKNLSIPVYLLGGSEDAGAGRQIAQDLDHVYNLCGKLSISDSARIIKEASVVISHDTAIMHIAAAFNRPIVSIWGNTVPEFGMFPFYPEKESAKFHVVQVQDLPCRPCSKIGFNACPKGHFRCMVQQDTDYIIEVTDLEISNI